MVPGAGEHLVECVPNFSEGRRPAVMDAIVAAVRSVPGAILLDRHADATHNRLVLTFAGGSGPVAEAAFRAALAATTLINMDEHRGVHPRLGALDVLPFVPLGGTPMAHCVTLAQRVGRRLAAELALPIYLYGLAATQPRRRDLPSVRRAGYEWLRERISQEHELRPDFGPSRLGPAGATAVGARDFLVAYNVTLATDDLTVAKEVARVIRAANGGLPAVQALGLATAAPGVVQVSVNLLDTRQTPIHVVFERIRHEAETRGVAVIESELVGLIPTDALAEAAGHALRLPGLAASSAVEARVLEGLLLAPEIRGPA